MSCSYVVINDNHQNFLKIQTLCEDFQELHFMAFADNYSAGIDAVLEHQPQLVFLEIEPNNKKSKLSLLLINELYRYSPVLPKIIVTAKSDVLAYDAIKFGVLDYLIAPFQMSDLRKTMLKIENTTQYLPVNSSPFPHVGSIVSEGAQVTTMNQTLTICIKSYGDYRFIDAADVLYLQADNNSTDIHLNNGEMITAFKTLKHFEKVLPAEFFRIHNSYIINKDYISRIHSGNSVCFIKNTSTKIPFSKSYKRNINKIILSISYSDYLEI